MINEILFSVCLLMSACITPQTSNGTDTEKGIEQNSIDTTTYTQNLKPQMAGLIARSFDYVDTINPDIKILGIVNGIVLKASWRDIQPDNGSTIKHPNEIDQAIAFARRINAENPGLNLKIKLRVHCGVFSPEWLKKKVGSFNIEPSNDYQSDNPADTKVPCFWKDSYQAAFESLQIQLAALYDTVPEIAEVVNGGTGVVFAESFMRRAGTKGKAKLNTINYLSAGYTVKQDEASIKKSISAMRAWKQTRVSMAFNPFAAINSANDVADDAQIAISIMDFFIKTLGPQAIMGNNGLRDNNADNADRWQPGGDMYTVSNAMKNYHEKNGNGVYYQTAAGGKLGDFSRVIELGVSLGAGSIELPGGSASFLRNYTLEQLKKFDKALEQQAAH